MTYNPNRIPVCLPKLPRYTYLKGYLSQIDESRFYTNFGPLENRLKERISDEFNIKKEFLTTVSSGTQALQLILRSFNFQGGDLVLCSSWTFVATAQAIVSESLTPIFIDPSKDNWQLYPEKVKKAKEKFGSKLKAVILTAPFGESIDVRLWEAVKEDINLEIVIDAAALALDYVLPSYSIPIMVSLHATKLLPAAEGGLVISGNQGLIEEVKQLSNFGISSKGIFKSGTNSKLSEYHAAVGLASIDHWEEISDEFQTIQKIYQKNFAGMDSVALFSLGNSIKNTVIAISKRDISNYCHSKGIETRKWWRFGCHKEPYFEKFDRFDSLEVTEAIANNYIGLPCFRDLDTNTINYISDIVIEASREANSR